MTKQHQQSDFESEYQYHRREWAVQRVGWAIIAVVLAAAVAGVFGDGPLSEATVTAGPHTIEYERFARYGARTTLIVNAARNESDSGELQIHIPHAFMDSYYIEAVTPEPMQMVDTGEELSLVFDAGSMARIILRLQPDKIGRHTGAVRIGSQSLRVSQFVYP